MAGDGEGEVGFVGLVGFLGLVGDGVGFGDVGLTLDGLGDVEDVVAGVDGDWPGLGEVPGDALIGFPGEPGDLGDVPDVVVGFVGELVVVPAGLGDAFVVVVGVLVGLGEAVAVAGEGDGGVVAVVV